MPANLANVRESCKVGFRIEGKRYGLACSNSHISHRLSCPRRIRDCWAFVFLTVENRLHDDALKGCRCGERLPCVQLRHGSRLHAIVDVLVIRRGRAGRGVTRQLLDDQLINAQPR